MEFEAKSKVYIQTDAEGRIIRCEGGYTMSNIDDVSKWTYIDEGTGDRYNLCAEPLPRRRSVHHAWHSPVQVRGWRVRAAERGGDRR